jgi:hypothetical protein
VRITVNGNKTISLVSAAIRSSSSIHHFPREFSLNLKVERDLIVARVRGQWHRMMDGREAEEADQFLEACRSIVHWTCAPPSKLHKISVNKMKVRTFAGDASDVGQPPVSVYDSVWLMALES